MQRRGRPDERGVADRVAARQLVNINPFEAAADVQRHGLTGFACELVELRAPQADQRSDSSQRPRCVPQQARSKHVGAPDRILHDDPPHREAREQAERRGL